MEKPSGKATGQQTRTAHGASVEGRRAPERNTAQA